MSGAKQMMGYKMPLQRSTRYAVPPNFDPFRFSPPPRKAPKDRHAMIAEEAYFRALRRDFLPGHELEDWLAAEAEVDRRLEGIV
jgi:hypothetical protein